MNNYRNEINKSNKRLRVGEDIQARVEQAREARHIREHRQRLRRAAQEQEDRERYIIPEHLDLEERLSG